MEALAFKLPLALLASVEYRCGKPRKLLKQVDKFDIFINKNTKIFKLLKKDVFKIVIPKKFVTLDKVVTLEKISSNTQNSHPIIQA